MASGGFVEAAEPGTWMKDDVQVDLMVPEALAGAGRRGPKLGVHGNKVTRKARGLEGSLVDSESMTISAPAGDDPRSLEVAVAGPAALLVSQIHKIQDRIGSPNRLTDKDALDVYRLLFAVDTKPIVHRVRKLTSDALSRHVTVTAVSGLQQLFGTPASAGTILAGGGHSHRS